VVRHEHLAQIDSTNDEALRRWRRACEQFPRLTPQPVLVTADIQTAGRGRQGRVWRSPLGGLWLTLAWPAPRNADDYRAVPLVAGLAVAEAIAETTELEARIKWPNDLLIEDRKVCGVLCQFEPLHHPVVIVGVGVNANLKTEALGRSLRCPATSLQEALGRPVDLRRLREVVGRRLVSRLRVFERDGIGMVIGSIRKRLAWVGNEITCERPGGEAIVGRYDGIDDAGCILIADPKTGGARAFDAGEVVHVTPAPCTLTPTPDPMELPSP